MDQQFPSYSLYDDGIGRVTLLDVMGDQQTPAEDARTSTDKGRLDLNRDMKLCKRLLRDRHTSPFEGSVVKIEAVVPLFVLRELERHRTLDISDDEALVVETRDEDLRKWFSRNEMSGRYVALPDLYYVPKRARLQSTTNQQGQSAQEAPQELSDWFCGAVERHTRESRALYDEALQRGVERGLARIVNPPNQYVRIRLTGSLKNWLDFLLLRDDPKLVLWECWRVAEAIHMIMDEVFPGLMEHWREEIKEGARLSRSERRMLVELMQDVAQGKTGAAVGPKGERWEQFIKLYQRLL